VIVGCKIASVVAIKAVVGSYPKKAVTVKIDTFNLALRQSIIASIIAESQVIVLCRGVMTKIKQ